jgi:hypothetical protein
MRQREFWRVPGRPLRASVAFPAQFPDVTVSVSPSPRVAPRRWRIFRTGEIDHIGEALAGSGATWLAISDLARP